jgi:hypothetical protein
MDGWAITVQTICTHYVTYSQQKGGKIEAKTFESNMYVSSKCTSNMLYLCYKSDNVTQSMNKIKVKLADIDRI